MMFVIMPFRYVDITVDRRMSNILKFSEMVYLIRLAPAMTTRSNCGNSLSLACLTGVHPDPLDVKDQAGLPIYSCSRYLRFQLFALPVIHNFSNPLSTQRKTIQENRIYLLLTRGRPQVTRYESEQD